MNRLTWLGGLTAAVAFAVLTNTSIARAQEDGGALVYTTCEQGVLEECGERKTGTGCSYSWGLDFNPGTRSFGVKYNGQTCTGYVTTKLYRNYKKGETDFGACHTVTFKRDATTVSPDGDDGSLESEC